MNIIYADYNIYHNSIDICTYAGYIRRMSAAGFEAKLIELPENIRKSIFAEMLENRPKLYSAKKENYSPLFYAGLWVFKEDAEAAGDIYS